MAMKPQRILIADDDTKLVALLKSSLQKSGYATSEALDGESALEQVKAEKPDLILADIVMPKIDGFELCKIIRENPNTADIPFVFLTAKGELNDRVKGLNLGADDYISKPFHISEVTARIKSILQRRILATSEVEDEGETALKGNLQQMNLAEILQTLAMNKKSGGLKIINQSKIGKMYFDSGNIVQAALEKYKSEEAVYRILAWDEGYFEFDSNDKADKVAITTSTNSLLMEGFRQRDEYMKYQQAMPAYDSVVKLSERERVEEMKAAPQKVVALIDGQRTIQEIVNISPISYLLTVKILYTLLKKGIAEAIEPEREQQAQEEDYSQLAQELYE
jgi:CheY-like chemotaxis protein